ncbi:MAG TPA: helix-hairpin-helix domain-containing protein [Bacteroidales bacterium]|nr:helix-hairpin-helix domain-containing protein [Bacteroidales bacterium]
MKSGPRKALKAIQLKALREIPGVGKSIAEDLWNIGIRKMEDLKGKNPQDLYDRSNREAGCIQDRCLLYVFRCAVYYVNTPPGDHEDALLQWWNWKER